MLETAEEVLSLNKKEKEVNLVPKLSTEITKQDLSNRVGYNQPAIFNNSGLQHYKGVVKMGLNLQ